MIWIILLGGMVQGAFAQNLESVRECSGLGME